MIQIRWFLIGLIALLTPQLCLSMEQETASAWRDELYHNAFLGEKFAELDGAMSIAQEIDYCESMLYTEEKDFGTPRPVLIMYDWLLTLSKVEKKLLRKPFHLWTMDDIRFIAANLSRLTHETPSRYRTTEEHRILRSFTDEEKKSYYPKLTEFLKEFARREGDFALPSLQRVASFYPAGAACFHTPPASIDQELKKAVSKAQVQFKDHYSDWGKERENSIIRIASELAVDIMRIRPFPQANMRLGVVLTFIIFKQAGLVPMPVNDRARYVRLLVLSLQLNSARPLIQYWKKAVKKCPMEELLKELDTPAAYLWPIKQVNVRPECIIPCDDLVRSTGDSYKADNNSSQNETASDSDESVTTTEEVKEPDDSEEPADEEIAQDELEEERADEEVGLDIRALARALQLMKQRENVVTVQLCKNPDCYCRLRNEEARIQVELKKEKSSLGAHKKILELEAEQIKKDLAMLKVCSGCGKYENGTTLKVCGKCKYQYYCDRECQAKDWPQHKLFCLPPKQTQ